MKRAVLAAVLSFLSLLLFQPPSLMAQAPDPVQIVKDYVATANTGDFDKTLAFYADDAIVKNPLGLFVGKDEIAGWLKQDVQTTRATSQAFQVNGSLVTNTGMVSLGRLQALGIGPVPYQSEYVIENGKIRFFSPVITLTPDQQAKVQAASANTPAPAAATGQPDPVQVVKDYVATANAGDFDKTFAFYADNAIVKNGVGLFVGKDQIGQWLQQDVQTTRAMQQTVLSSGSTIVSLGTVSLARFEKLGIGSVQYRAEYMVADGKIVYFSPRMLLSPDQQAAVQAAGKAPSAGPSTLPESGASNVMNVLPWLAAALAGVALVTAGALFMRRRA